MMVYYAAHGSGKLADDNASLANERTEKKKLTLCRNAKQMLGRQQKMTPEG